MQPHHAILRSLRWVFVLAVLLIAAGAAAQPDSDPPAGPPSSSPAEPAPADAAPPPDEDTGASAQTEDARAAAKEEAKRRFLRGIELAKSSDWDGALVEFLASREIYPTQVATRNAARALQQLQRYVEAADMNQVLLDEFGSELDAKDRAEIQQILKQLNERIGQLTLESNQPGTTVIIDGQEQGQTPLGEPVRVKAGTHMVRAYKEGFLPFEKQVMVAGGQRQVVKAELRPLTRSGELRVTEASGGSYEVIVDSASVGTTPWQGPLGPGEHTVFLRGDEKMGTMPNRVEIREGQTTTIALEAQRLDATIRVEPKPSDARVAIDGVTVGNGIWEGAVPSGAHEVEVYARGFLAFKEPVRVKPDETKVVRATLQRNPEHPMWGDAFRSHLYLEAALGAALAPSFGGTAGGDALPVGVLGGLRVGYALISGLGIEVTLGYLAMRQSSTRTISAEADPHVVSFESTDFTDEQRIAGPLAALSASYQILEETPLTFRLMGGAARVSADFNNGGTFDGISEDPSGQRGNFSVEFDLEEEGDNLTLPFVGGEVRFGYRLGEQFLIDVGVGVLGMFAGDVERRAFDGGPRSIAYGTSPGQYGDGSPIPPPGEVVLPRETAFGTFVGIFPTVGARYDF